MRHGKRASTACESRSCVKKCRDGDTTLSPHSTPPPSACTPCLSYLPVCPSVCLSVRRPSPPRRNVSSSTRVNPSVRPPICLSVQFVVHWPFLPGTTTASPVEPNRLAWRTPVVDMNANRHENNAAQVVCPATRVHRRWKDPFHSTPPFPSVRPSVPPPLPLPSRPPARRPGRDGRDGRDGTGRDGNGWAHAKAPDAPWRVGRIYAAQGPTPLLRLNNQAISSLHGHQLGVS